MDRDGNLWVGDTGWHPDGSEPGYGRIKVAFYLDPIYADTGCMRVVPGSHRPPLHQALRVLHDDNGMPIADGSDPGRMPFGVTLRDVPSVPIETQPGDVTLMNQDLWHGSFGGTVRRQFALTLLANPTTGTWST